jgi:hypothetical protein
MSGIEKSPLYRDNAIRFSGSPAYLPERLLADNVVMDHC